jgi:uncharacterized protein YhaN
MIETIQNTLPLISLLVSGYTLYLYFNQKQNNNLIEENQKLLEKHILIKDKEIKELNINLKKYDDNMSSIKYKLQSENSNLEKKVVELYERWLILADDRITSVPQSNKEWWEAKEIINQKKEKIWKPKNLSQSKSSIINNGNQYTEIDEEINQDFTQLDEETFENIIDEDETDSSSTGSDTNAQTKKPKPKKTTNQIKM